jgi:N-acetyl-anhydromuramyl-L-alanine amidase AmpD
MRSTAVPKPRIDWDPIPYGKNRKRQMANYSHRHYGKRTWRLRNPKVIVLHYTATSTYGPVRNTFAANAPTLGERPGVCAQFVVAKDGTIHQLTRLGVRCRHTVGLNQTAIGIEMVQQAKSGKHAADRAILRRRDQIRAATRLTAWLKQRYRIRMRDVIGHSMANGSRYFEDREGWRNDHVDWLGSDVRDFRRIVGRVIRKHR